MINKTMSFFTSERGDTNYIAIIILIAVVIALACVFRTFMQQGMETVRQAFENFLHSLGF